MPSPTSQLWQTSIIALFASLILIWATFFLINGWAKKQKLILVTLIVLLGFGFITAKSSILSAYYNYDSAEEYLVYAHSGPGVKTVMDQIDEISKRLTGNKDMVVAYDNHSLYPYWWYLRDYPNQKYFADNPGKDILEAPVVLVGVDNYGKVEPILRKAYDQYEYVRVWWPNQDYWTPSYLMGFLQNQDTRWDFIHGVLDIWLNRDYTEYAAVTGKDMTTENWNPSQKFSMFVRKDVASSAWEFGAPAFDESLLVNDYEEQLVLLEEKSVILLNDETLGSLNAPRDIALSENESFFVADSRNHRIVEFSLDGDYLNSFGSSSIGLEDKNGKFNEPWGLTVAPDGSIFVADTWDHQIEKFDAKGNYVTSWGVFANGADPYAMYGPRDVVIDNDGNVLMSDTGNKRITVFTQNGLAINSFGSYGVLAGEFDEPVGIAYDAERNILFVADAWNQRMQSFLATGNNAGYAPLYQWDVNSWYGQDLENKPYIAIGSDGRILVADPIFSSITLFEPDGTYVATLQDANNGLGMASGLAVTDDGLLLVSDGSNNVIHVYEYPIVEALPKEVIEPDLVDITPVSE